MVRHTLVVLLIALHVRIVHCKIPLHIAALQEWSNTPFFYDFPKHFTKVIEYGLEEINNHSEILVDFDLQFIYRDTKYSGGYAAKMMMELLTEDPPKVAVFGPTLTDHLDITAQIAPYYNIVQMAYHDVSGQRATTGLYPTLFSVNQLATVLNPLRIQFMKYFGWTRVATISAPGDLYEDQMRDFHRELDVNNMTLVASAIIAPNLKPKEIVQQFKELNVRIVMLATSTRETRQIFCQAYHQKMYGTGYVWVLSGPTMNGFDLINSGFYNPEMAGCTKEELIEATMGHFTVDYSIVSRQDTVTISGQIPSKLIRELQQLPGKFDWSYRRFCGLVYDGLWSLAVGLNHSLKYLEEQGLRLQNYNYTDVYLDAVLKGMHETLFNGVSGPVSFDQNGRRFGTDFIKQRFDSVSKDVATYCMRQGLLTWLVPSDSLWQGAEPPKDSFEYHQRLVEPNIVALCIVIVIVTFGSALSASFFGFNITYRHHRAIKLSSPVLNNVMIAGGLLMHVGVVVSIVDYANLIEKDSDNNLCMVKIWFLALGFTTMFGALFSKTYRVYVIFRNYTMKKRHIKDAHLLAVVGILVAVDWLILLPWSVFHPLHLELVPVRSQIVMESNAIVTEVQAVCSHPFQGYWTAAAYVYTGLLLAFGTFIAWETRTISVPELNDSKYIGACIYNVVIVCLFGVPMLHVLPSEQASMRFILEGAFVVLSTSICQCIIFIPKILRRHQIQPRFLTPQLPSSKIQAVITINRRDELIDTSTTSDFGIFKQILYKTADSPASTTTSSPTLTKKKNQLAIVD